jgi:hypothetical protein
MSNVVEYVALAETLKGKTLEDLFAEASTYGHIYLHEDKKDRTFHLRITFESIPGTSLEAKSDFNRPTIADALIQAITRAKEMAAQFKN